MVKMTSAEKNIEITVTAPAEYDIVSAGELILRKYGPRAITVLTSPRQMPDGRWIQPKLSANDAYVALEEACRKVARVAIRKARQNPDLPFEQNLDVIFPDPVAYLARAVKSVISDEGRLVRRDIPTVSLEQPLAVDDGDGSLQLGDTVAEDRAYKLPEVSLVERDEKQLFRAALNKALKTIPANYLEAIKRDIARERERQAGVKVTPETDRERQTICRARAALATILKREAGEDNPYIRLLAQQRSGRVKQKAHNSGSWSGERQEALFRKLMQTGWTERAATRSDESVDEAVINEVSIGGGMAPPSPELRQAVRVLDLYTVDQPTPKSAPAQDLYARALKLRQAGKLEEALKTYRACYEAEPGFIEALNEVGVMYSQLGNLRDALKVYLTIIERDPAGDHKYIAATNAADIYLTWFDAGRNKEKNIELAIRYAQKAMQKPTPMRACNLTLAYVKDRYYEDAKQVMDFVLKSNLPNCPSEKYLQTLFQIRDADLIAWLNWLDSELA